MIENVENWQLKMCTIDNVKKNYLVNFYRSSEFSFTFRGYVDRSKIL